MCCLRFDPKLFSLPNWCTPKKLGKKKRRIMPILPEERKRRQAESHKRWLARHLTDPKRREAYLEKKRAYMCMYNKRLQAEKPEWFRELTNRKNARAREYARRVRERLHAAGWTRVNFRTPSKDNNDDTSTTTARGPRPSCELESLLSDEACTAMQPSCPHPELPP